MLSVIPTSILLCCHFEETCVCHTSLECKCVIMLINASGVKISNWGASYSRCFRRVHFKASHVVFMKPTGLACPLIDACYSRLVHLGLPSHQCEIKSFQCRASVDCFSRKESTR